MKRCYRENWSCYFWEDFFWGLNMDLTVCPLANFSPMYSTPQNGSQGQVVVMLSCAILWTARGASVRGQRRMLLLLSLVLLREERRWGEKMEVRHRGGWRRGEAVAEVSCAAAAQLSGGRRGHFSLPAIRCNADGSQGYACVDTLTDWSIEDAGAGSPRDSD